MVQQKLHRLTSNWLVLYCIYLKFRFLIWDLAKGVNGRLKFYTLHAIWDNYLSLMCWCQPESKMGNYVEGGHVLPFQPLCIKHCSVLQEKAWRSWPPFTTNHLMILGPSTVCIVSTVTLQSGRGKSKPKSSWKKWVMPSHPLQARLSPGSSLYLPTHVHPS